MNQTFFIGFAIAHFLLFSWVLVNLNYKYYVQAKNNKIPFLSKLLLRFSLRKTIAKNSYWNSLQ